MSDTFFTRRQFLAATTAASLLTPGIITGAEKKRRPNIVFILADDLGYQHVGCYGQKSILTPRIDRMASEGIRFTQCYSGSTVCAPSRSVLMTGQHVGHTRVRWNTGLDKPDIPASGGRVPLLPEDYTFAKMLQTAGYKTGMFGKWGLGESGSTGEPNLHGFDEWFGNRRKARLNCIIWKQTHAKQ